MKKAFLVLVSTLLVFSQLSLGSLSVYAISNAENDIVTPNDEDESEALNNEDETVTSNNEVDHIAPIENEKGNGAPSDNDENETLGNNEENGKAPNNEDEVSAINENEDEFITRSMFNGVVITGYKGSSKDIVIPDEINGKPVLEIGYRAFANKRLTNVEMPSSVTTIGIGAFADNQLTSVEIPSSVATIGDRAFADDQLTSVEIPSGVTTIGERAFADNQLTSVEIPSSVTTIGIGAFSKNQLTSIEIPSRVKKIEPFAFTDNQLTSIKIPTSVTTIEIGAFSENQLTKIELPPSVTTIGNSAFSENRLTSIELSSGLETIGERAFFSNQLTNIEIPTSVKTIENYAFAYNQMTSVEIPASVTTIESEAFSYNQLDFITFHGVHEFQWATTPFKFQFKSGKSFLGWFEDEDYTINWSDTVSKPMTVYAKWSPLAVMFDTDGGNEVPSQTVEHGELVKIPSSPVKAGYTFEGWYKDKGLIEAWNFDQDVVKKDITLYAKWSKESFIVTFDANGGSEVPSQSVEYGEFIKALSNPVKAGYTFEGWYKDKELTEVWNFDQDVVKKDITLHAKWSKASYIVTFDSNGGSEVSSQKVGYNELVKVPAAQKKKGYTFDGWHKDKELTVPWDIAKDVVTQNVTLYAKWIKDNTAGGGSGWTHLNTVTFDSNGGSEVQPQTVGFNDLVKAPTTLMKDGYQFTGWYKDAELKNVWDFAKDKVTSDITLYAKWTKDNVSEGSFIVTFDSNGGSKIPSQTVAYKALVKAASKPTKEGHIFIGWYKNKDFTKAWDFAKDVVTADITLYARWMKESSGCDITFNDISTNWAQDMIKEVAKRCIIKGYPDGTFRPNDLAQRQHVVLMIDRALQPTPIREAVSFSDVPKNHVYYEQITRLQRAGIVDGTNGTFRPDAYITRAQMAKMMVIAFGLTPEGNSTFKDVDPSHWASGYIATLADHNIALGDENGNFRPDENLTRAQFTAFMYRALGL
ncbi:putative repeat protein (TIGR02543 family) [Lysinibacillus sp. RC46]|uniref:InlB B-repeat-containing protein n=1 Tax=Lysinibacillus sp. RC46 TaxID=3156295 RepID=UPI003514EAFE